ncbi:TetR/AcrR family transcriptional regulator [Sulfitobacter dubius]|uniref:TetR/AcrR family transcriptional regulator n=1 Tax=Sulfitobacter dubius TaxID=218673 RepID=UPI0029437FD9|nr:helix-turn-helix domain-containing protein [Sulfitobacter dubius]WOI30763.1 helix-turn-helix domain-containing protein [Sulfitobacter dubius]
MKLRERRRLQTARDIQMAAVTVALRNGLDQTTTEAIAVEAGISTRTFFNYYNNKYAAILGEAVRLDVTGAEWFVNSTGSIVNDLAKLLGQGFQENPLDRALLLKIIAVVDANPALLDMFRARIDETSGSIASLLERRLGSGLVIEARLLAELSTRTLSEALMAWAMDDAMTLDAVTIWIATKLQSAGKLMWQSDQQSGLSVQ